MKTEPLTRDAGFVRAIVAEPEDDALRLIYADWLQERGDPRGEFIRAQMDLTATGMYDCPTPVRQEKGSPRSPIARLRCGRCRFCRAMMRCQELLDAGHHTAPYPHRFGIALTLERGFPHLSRGPLCWFRRGFITEVKCTCAVWLDLGVFLARQAPLTRVWITDRSAMHRGRFRAWYMPEPGAILHTDGAAHPYLPPALFRLLPGGIMQTLTSTCREYPQGEETQALSAACLAHARNEDDR